MSQGQRKGAYFYTPSGGNKMKIKILCGLLLLSSCSSVSSYTIDPRASKEPKEIIRDKLECRELVKTVMETKHEKIWGIIPICTTNQCMKWKDPFYDPMKKCLENRGHSILN